jgi:hypothetical protein
MESSNLFFSFSLFIFLSLAFLHSCILAFLQLSSPSACVRVLVRFYFLLLRLLHLFRLLRPPLLPLLSVSKSFNTNTPSTTHVFAHAMPPTPRIRTVEGSCWGCKQRRVICDLAVPTCGKCAKIGRRCDYGTVRLRWTDCVASRGRLAGKKIPLYQPPALQRSQDQHLLYFENELLPRLNMSNTVPRIDLSFLSRDPILSQSVIAVANAHQTYAYQSSDENSAVARIQDRNNALRVFRKHLMAAHNDEVNHSLFIANVLLCILDGMLGPTTENSAAAAHYHLVGGKAILKHWEGGQDIFDQTEELPILMLSIFTTMDLTHSLLIGDEPYLDQPSWARFGNCEAWWGNVKSDDDFLQTMGILSNLATLGHSVRHFSNTVPIDTLLAIQTSLDEQANRLTVDDETHGSVERSAWAAFCSVYRFTASVYLYRALSGLDVDHHLVQQAVSSCMEVISSPALPSQLQHCILFPLLVVGTLCIEEDQRVTIRRSIERTSAYLSFESLRSLTLFLEGRWKMLDQENEAYRKSDWWSYFEDIALATCLF